MIERQTIEVTLPESNTKISLYSHITSGDFRKIQRKLLRSIRISIDSKNGAQVQSKGLTADSLILEQDFTLNILTKSIVDGKGEVIPQSEHEDFYYNISIDDGNFLFETLNDISEKSRHSDENKKK